MDGFINVFKPSRLTSHDVVVRVRRIFGEDKVGHFGTLDPMATGVLPVAIGSYRRLCEYLIAGEKEYLCEVTLGMATDTGDITGRELSKQPNPRVTSDLILKILPELIGEILQVPPAYSALKVGGKKLYQLARRGVTPDIPPRAVRVHEFKMLDFRPGSFPRALFRIRASKGTYIRSLAVALGERLGCGACVSYLVRLASGPFRLKDAVTIGEMDKAKRSGSLEELLTDPVLVLPRDRLVYLRGSASQKLPYGVPLSFDDLEHSDLPFGTTLFGVSREGLTSKVLCVFKIVSGKIVYEKVLV